MSRERPTANSGVGILSSTTIVILWLCIYLDVLPIVGKIIFNNSKIDKLLEMLNKPCA